MVPKQTSQTETGHGGAEERRRNHEDDISSPQFLGERPGPGDIEEEGGDTQRG